MADANMIVAAAETYHTPGKGGAQATPVIIQHARATVAEGQQALEARRGNINYWEARVQVGEASSPEAAHRQQWFCVVHVALVHSQNRARLRGALRGSADAAVLLLVHLA